MIKNTWQFSWKRTGLWTEKPEPGHYTGSQVLRLATELFTEHGIEAGSFVRQTGLWEGELEPSLAFTVIGRFPIGAAYTIAQELANIFGQDSVLFTLEDSNHGDTPNLSRAVLIDGDGTVTGLE
jgi:hypothetical protein